MEYVFYDTYLLDMLVWGSGNFFPRPIFSCRFYFKPLKFGTKIVFLHRNKENVLLWGSGRFYQIERKVKSQLYNKDWLDKNCENKRGLGKTHIKKKWFSKWSDH